MDRQGQSSRRSELQGPRPTPLRVRKDSHKIRKPPVAPPPTQGQNPPPQPQPRAPVIIYAVSPKVIHTSPSGFMSLVQRLTGPDSTTTTYPPPPPPSDPFASTATSALSPAARFAMIEKTRIPLESKSNYDNSSSMEGADHTSVYDTSDIRPGGGFVHSILSPGPSGLLQAVPPTFFSHISDPSPLVNMYHQQNHVHHEDYLNALHYQFQHGGVGGSGGSFAGSGISSILPSPGAFLSPNPMLSPASIEFLRRILDQ